MANEGNHFPSLASQRRVGRLTAGGTGKEEARPLLCEP